MSISAIGGTTPWWATQASGAAVTSDAAAASSSTSATNASGLGNFFQQFASDLQSLLTQVQATTGGTVATAAPGTTTQAATAPGTTNAATTGTGTTPADTTTQAATAQPEAVHHHHHHHGGGEGGGGGNPLQNAANQFVSQVAQALGGGSGNATPAAGTTANGASTLAADIVHALQNYGAFAATPAPGTVSTTA